MPRRDGRGQGERGSRPCRSTHAPQAIQRRAHVRERHRAGAENSHEGRRGPDRSRTKRRFGAPREHPQHHVLGDVHHRGPHGQRERLARQANGGNRVVPAEIQQRIEDQRQEMVVHVAVDRQRTPIAERPQEPLDLPSKLQPNLGAQTRRAGARKPLHPQRGEPPMEPAAIVNEQIQPRGVGKRVALEQVQVQRNGQVRTKPKCGDRMVPAGTVGHHARTAQPPVVTARHDGVGDAGGKAAIVGMHDRDEPGGHVGRTAWDYERV